MRAKRERERERERERGKGCLSLRSYQTSILCFEKKCEKIRALRQEKQDWFRPDSRLFPSFSWGIFLQGNITANIDKSGSGLVLQTRMLEI